MRSVAFFEGNGVYRISYFENHAVEVVWEYREGEWDAERESENCMRQ